MSASSLGTLTTDRHKETISHLIDGGDPDLMIEMEEIGLVLEEDLDHGPKKDTDQITKPIHLTFFGIFIVYYLNQLIFILGVKKRGIVVL